MPRARTRTSTRTCTRTCTCTCTHLVEGRLDAAHPAQRRQRRLPARTLARRGEEPKVLGRDERERCHLGEWASA
eukprot:scaffold102359_cov39-Phaeocystis_antarctica.AAC.2